MCRKEFKFKRFQGTVDRVDIGGRKAGLEHFA